MTYSKSSLQWAQTLADGQGAHAEAMRELADVSEAGDCKPITSGMTDRELCRLAVRRVEHMRREIESVLSWAQDAEAASIIGQTVKRLGAKPMAWAGDLDAIARRARCPIWWRRQLRNAVVTLREDEGRWAGEICARRQVYVTNDTLARRTQSNARNAAILAATEIESSDGEVITLAQAAGASVSNRSIRRGELMTRIRGCEEWAEARGMVGLFTTNTAPSRFHAQHYGGGRNHRHFGEETSSRYRAKGKTKSTVRFHGNYGPVQPNGPREAQGWLCATWARARSQLQRLKVPFFGFRVAEPHHDGCPHWHMLLWTDAAHMEKLRTVLRAQWLKDHPEEWGAADHRFKAVDMESGGAAGYIAKYIAKNIDDPEAVHDLAGQLDDFAYGTQDLFGGAAARRVEAWAAARHIRQFQAIGQPPITVWRELRRVAADVAEQAPVAVQAAHAAATRDPETLRRADWRAYMDAQGGAMTGRRYRVRMLTEEHEAEGRYGLTVADRPIGVIASSAPDRWVLSSRRVWTTRGRRPDEFANVATFGAAGVTVARGPNPAYAEHMQALAARLPAGPALGIELRGVRVLDDGAILVGGVLGIDPATLTPEQWGDVDLGALARPWTRVNNCTRATVIDGRIIGRHDRFKTWDQLIEPGGSALQPLKDSPCPLPEPSRPSSLPSRLALLRSLT